MDDKERIRLLKEQVAYLFDEKRFALDALQTVTTLGYFDAGLNKLEKPDVIVEETVRKAGSLIRFSAAAVFLINEKDSAFYQAYCSDTEHEPFFQEEIDAAIEDGTFNWALDRGKPVIINSKTADETILFHSLTTPSRARGMFIGLLQEEKKDILDSSLLLLTVVMHSSASALESFELYKRIRMINLDLEDQVKDRTKELTATNAQLTQEIEEREKIQQALQLEKEFIAAILENSSDGIAVVGSSGVVQFYSPGMERIFGYRADEVFSVDDWAQTPFNSSESNLVIKDLIDEARREGTLIRIFPIINKDGERRWCRFHIKGSPDGSVIINGQDVTRLETQRLQLVKQKKLIDQDLRAAAFIQKSLLPEGSPEFKAVDVASSFQPCSTIGGDIYDVFTLPDGKVGIHMLDVSGHGVASAIIAISVSNFLHDKEDTLINAQTGRAYEPEIVLNKLDEEFPIHRFERHFTMIYIVVDPKSSTAMYSNAGHPMPVVLKAQGGIELMDRRGPVVGLRGFKPFGQETLPLDKGDKVVLYSDGVIEYRDPEGNFFGEKRLLDCLTAHRDRPIHDLIGALHGALKMFGGDEEPMDDITILGFEFNGI